MLKIMHSVVGRVCILCVRKIMGARNRKCSCFYSVYVRDDEKNALRQSFRDDFQR